MDHSTFYVGVLDNLGVILDKTSFVYVGHSYYLPTFPCLEYRWNHTDESPSHMLFPPPPIPPPSHTQSA